MGPFSMTVLIVLIVSVAKVLNSRYRAMGRGQQGAESWRTGDEVRQLRERVAVLERVVTENHKSLDLDREIERLRDGRGEDRAARERREQA